MTTLATEPLQSNTGSYGSPYTLCRLDGTPVCLPMADWEQALRAAGHFGFPVVVTSTTHPAGHTPLKEIADPEATLNLAKAVLAEAEEARAPAAEIAKLRAAIETGDWLDQYEATDDLRYSLGHFCSECRAEIEPGTHYCSRDCWLANGGDC